MKNLNEKLKDWKILFTGVTLASAVLIGFGVYNNDIKMKKLQIEAGIMLNVLATYLLVKEDEKKFPKKNYQTKLEDYQIKK